MKKELPLLVVKIKYDRFGITYIECPRCDNYCPCVNPGDYQCPVCNQKFKVIE
jgi:uncharacterized C2H2 Zn-finger protein